MGTTNAYVQLVNMPQGGHASEQNALSKNTIHHTVCMTRKREIVAAPNVLITRPYGSAKRITALSLTTQPNASKLTKEA